MQDKSVVRGEQVAQDEDARIARGEQNATSTSAAPSRALTPAAQRALAEAEARRQARVAPARPEEVDGRGGEEPVRYGDWEVKGLATDF